MAFGNKRIPRRVVRIDGAGETVSCAEEGSSCSTPQANATKGKQKTNAYHFIIDSHRESDILSPSTWDSWLSRIRQSPSQSTQKTKALFAFGIQVFFEPNRGSMSGMQPNRRGFVLKTQHDKLRTHHVLGSLEFAHVFGLFFGL
jgi:hypothetical protein